MVLFFPSLENLAKAGNKALERRWEKRFSEQVKDSSKSKIDEIMQIYFLATEAYHNETKPIFYDSLPKFFRAQHFKNIFKEFIPETLQSRFTFTWDGVVIIDVSVEEGFLKSTEFEETAFRAA